MPNLLRLIDHLTTHQDYLWFLAALAWVGVAIGLWQRNDAGKFRAWILVWALGNTLSACVELHLLASDIDGPYVAWDQAMTAAQCLATGGLLWAACRRVAHAYSRAALVLAVLTVGSWARLSWPVAGGLLLALIHGLAVRGALRVAAAEHDVARADRSVQRFGAAGLQLSLLWVLLAPHGALAHALGIGRINRDLSPLAIPASLCLLLAGLAWCVAIWRQRLVAANAAAGAGVLTGRFRRSLLWLAAWLVAGFALIVWSGRSAQRFLEAGLVARVTTAAELLDRGLVARALGDVLVADGVRPRMLEVPFGGERRHLQLHLPATNSDDFRALRSTLTRIQLNNPEMSYVFLTTVRSGQVVIAAIDHEDHPTFPWRWVLRAAAPDELTRPDAAVPSCEGPVQTPFGPFVIARAPLRSARDSPVLGWLEFHFASTHWVAPATHARLQTMALVGLGVAFWGLGLAYELRRAVAAEAARKVAAAAETERVRTTFIANVSHELRTPIQSILGFGELLATECRVDPAKRWVAALRSHGEVMLQLVNDLIDHSALQSGVFRLHRRVVDLPQLVQDTVAAVQPRASAKGLATVVEIGPDVPAHVWIDPVRLRQILLNLLANAVKFTPRGEVRLVVRRAAAPAAAAVHPHVEFVVTDTGPGIPAAEREQLFQPFARLGAAPEIEGTGLGLALVARFCAAMDGRVWLDDTGGAGARFIVSLPLEIAPAPGADAPRENADVTQLWRHVRVLVAEDNALVRELLVDFFRRHGAEVTTAADGDEAIAACAAQAFHVALFDWMMPKCDGLEACRRLRRLPAGREVFVLGLSAHADGDGYAQALAAGMNGFIAKPVNLAALAEVVAEAPGVPRLPLATPATDAVLLSKLQVRFGLELPGLVDDIARAAAAGDWARAAARAHYLKNSADCVGARALSRACQTFFDQARAPAATPPDLDALTRAAVHPFGSAATEPLSAHRGNSTNTKPTIP